MVKRLFTIMLSLISWAPLQAATLTLLPAEKQIEHGRTVTINLRYVGPVVPDELNVNRWQTQVFTEKGYRTERELPDGQIEVTQRLTLFPRQSGLLTLGPLALGGVKSTRFDLMVTPAVVNQVDITPSWSTLPDQLWQGESFESCVRMPLSEQRSRMKVELPEVAGITVLQTQNRIDQLDGLLIAVHCWRLSSELPGNYHVELPPIIQRGRGRWTFYLPSQSLEVLPLPSYLPKRIAVGLPNIRIQTGDQGWRVVVQVDGREQGQPLWGIKSALADSLGISSDQIIDDGNELFVPYPRWSFGDINRVKLPYFNTETGRLDSVDLLLKAPWRLPTIALMLLTILGLVILIKGAFWGVMLLQRRSRRLSLKRAIQSATSADQLRAIVLETGLDVAHDRSGYKTLGDWADAQSEPEAVSLAECINQLAFSKECGVSLERMKQGLIHRLTA